MKGNSVSGFTSNPLTINYWHPNIWILCCNASSVTAMSLFIAFYKSRAVLRGGGQGFPHTTMNVAPGYFQRKTEEKWNQKKPPSWLIPCLLVVFTWPLDILVTTLKRVIIIFESDRNLLVYQKISEAPQMANPITTTFNPVSPQCPRRNSST